MVVNRTLKLYPCLTIIFVLFCCPSRAAQNLSAGRMRPAGRRLDNTGLVEFGLMSCMWHCSWWVVCYDQPMSCQPNKHGHTSHAKTTWISLCGHLMLVDCALYSLNSGHCHIFKKYLSYCTRLLRASFKFLHSPTFTIKLCAYFLDLLLWFSFSFKYSNFGRGREVKPRPLPSQVHLCARCTFADSAVLNTGSLSHECDFFPLNLSVVLFWFQPSQVFEPFLDISLPVVDDNTVVRFRRLLSEAGWILSLN